MTDVTSFGLFRVLTENYWAPDLQATVAFLQIAKLAYIKSYIEQESTIKQI
ncbi:MAG: hypothetical protein ACTS73_05115 [Arsenophonus sp. NEOnobi-MAG3]